MSAIMITMTNNHIRRAASSGGGGESVGFTGTMTIGQGMVESGTMQITGVSPYFNIGSLSLSSTSVDSIYVMEQDNNGQNGFTILYLIDGTYPEFTVSSAAIDGDLGTYPRIFKIDNVDYEFQYDGYEYFATTDVANLKSKVGSTINVSYSSSSQYTLPVNTLVVGYMSLYSTYGANRYLWDDYVYGKLSTPYITNITHVAGGPGDTNIKLIDGSYSGFTVSGGAIDGDGPAAKRKFTIGGSNYVFEWTGYTYANTSYDILQLESNVGNSFTVIYDPAANIVAGGPGTTYPIVTGGFGTGMSQNGLALTVSNSTTITALDGLSSGATIWIGQGGDNFPVTIVGTLTKSNTGPGGTWRIFTGTTTTTNPSYPSNYSSLDYLNF